VLAGTESSGKPRITADLKVDVAGKHVVVVSGSTFTRDSRIDFVWLAYPLHLSCGGVLPAICLWTDSMEDNSRDLL
jgi:hypothetical protein